MLKTAVFVSGGGTNLQAIIDAKNRGELPHAELSLVLSSKDGVYALERAKNAGIETEVIRKRDYPSEEEYNKAMLDAVEKRGIDVIVLAGFLSILGGDIIKKYDHRIINVHPALIPSFCGKGYYGLRVHEEALKKGVKVTGATVHFVNEVADGGEIIFQKAVDVMDGDTPEILQKRVMEQAEWILLPRALETVCKKLSEK